MSTARTPLSPHVVKRCLCRHTSDGHRVDPAQLAGVTEAGGDAVHGEQQRALEVG
jgi:hypothetical protein